MEQSHDTYSNFKLMAALCRILGQFPVINMNSLIAVEFKNISIVTVASLIIYTSAIYFYIQVVKDEKFHYIDKAFYIQLLFFYYINYFNYKKIITFLKDIKVFDDETQPLLNFKVICQNQLQKYYWVACGFLSLSSQILVIIFITIIDNEILERSDFLRVFCRSPLYLHGINYIFMLRELEVRLEVLRKSMMGRLLKMEKNPIDIMNHLIIEKYRFLHAMAIHCLASFTDAFSVILPAEFYFSGLAIIFNVYESLYGPKSEKLLKTVISATYDTVSIFYIVHQSWKIGREGLKFIEDIYQIRINRFDSQTKQQLDIFIKQMKMRPFIIMSLGIDISNWSVYSVYTTLIATYIIAMSQLSNQINTFLT